MLDRTVVRRSPASDQSPDSDLHPVLRRIVALRPCQYTDYVLNDLLRPDALHGLPDVIGRLCVHVMSSPRYVSLAIMIVMATATAVAVRGLDYCLPGRLSYSQSLSFGLWSQCLNC